MRAMEWTCDGCGAKSAEDPLRFEVVPPAGWAFWKVQIERLGQDPEDGEWRGTHTKFRNMDLCQACSARLESTGELPGRMFKTWAPEPP